MKISKLYVRRLSLSVVLNVILKVVPGIESCSESCSVWHLIGLACGTGRAIHYSVPKTSRSLHTVRHHASQIYASISIFTPS